jgi:sterol 14alpha-demethylase
MTTFNLISLFILALLLLIPIFYFFLRVPSIPSVPNATPCYPLIGNSVSYGIDPIKFLLDQKARHGNIFLVDLAVIRIVFFLGPDGTNAVLKGTDKSGISFWAAMKFVIGQAIFKGTIQIPLIAQSLMEGWTIEGWVENSTRVMQRILSSPEHFDIWIRLAKPIAKARFMEWTDSGEPIPIFRQMSNLVMTLVVNIIMGAEFAEKYGDEVVPMIQAYEWALQRPQAKALPRSLSEAGRILDSVEARMKQLVGEEILWRQKNPEKYEKNMDYMQSMLNAMGGEHIEGAYIP